MSIAKINKTIFYNIYSPDGTLVEKDWSDASFVQFSKKINGGFGECIINLAREFGDFGEGVDVRLNNRVEIFVYDKDTNTSTVNDVTGKRIYIGYISSYEPWASADGKQGVYVTLLGYHTKFAVDILKNTLQTKLYTKATVGLTTVVGDIAAADGGDIMKAILERYKEESSNVMMHYNGGDVDATSSNIEYTFDAETYLNAIERVRQMSPAGWYWFIDTDNFFHFKAKPTTITHTFYWQQQFNEIKVSKNMERMINTVLLDDGTTATNYREYNNAASQGEFGRRVLQKSEKYYGDTGTMDEEAANIIDTMNEPDIEVRLTLLDNNKNEYGYDIESIEVGDTVKIEGFEDSIFEEGMIIKEFTYRIDRMDLIIQPVKIGLFDKVMTMKRLQDISISDRDESYVAA